MSAFDRPPRYSIGAAWLALAFALILFATLHPEPGSTPGPPPALWLTLPGTAGEWLDVLQNVALYVPFGVALAGRGVTRVRAVQFAAALSIGTEFLQLAIPGRDPSSRDVVSNLIGTVLGYVIWLGPTGMALETGFRKADGWFVQARHADAARASRLCLTWAAVIAVIWLATGALLTPFIPSGLSVSSPYFDRSHGVLRIGNNGAPDGAFKGLIDEVRIYDHGRTAHEIRDDMDRPVAGQPHEQGLVAAFGFETDSHDMARDDSGNGHDGTLRNTTPYDHGRFGKAASFDGVSSEIVVPYAPAFELRDGMTLEAWVRRWAGSVPEPSIIAHEGTVYYLDESSTLGRGRSATGGRFGRMPRYARLGEPIPLDEWTHVAGTYDGQTLRLYVNGELSATEVHWSPHRPEQARLNGVELVPGDLADAEVLRTGSATDLQVRFSCGDRADTLAPVFLIAGLHNTPIVEWAAVGDNLVFRTYTWANRLHLQSPSTQLQHALASCREGRSVHVRLRGHFQNATFSLDGQTLDARPPGLGDALAFVIPEDELSHVLQRGATLGWLLLLAAPFGFCCRLTTMSMLAVSLTVAAYVAAMLLFHVRGFDTLEWVTILVGCALGRMYRRGRSEQ